ncbi:MAG: DUF1844 domain-containing protein [Candidatus Omnitrophota bacterium]
MDKDIRFSEKKVDDGWKEQVSREKSTAKPGGPAAAKGSAGQASGGKKETSKAFLNLLSSLGYQVMMNLGEIPHPETGVPELNLEAAKEILDLLTAMKEKTEGNLSSEESQFVQKLLPELQMKYAARI